MSDVIVTSVSDSDGSGDDQLETVTLSFARVDLEYKAPKADGTLSAGIHFKYDIKSNKVG